MSPLQQAIEEVKSKELISKDNDKPTGLVQIQAVIKILEEMEVKMLNEKKTNY